MLKANLDKLSWLNPAMLVCCNKLIGARSVRGSGRGEKSEKPGWRSHTREKETAEMPSQHWQNFMSLLKLIRCKFAWCLFCVLRWYAAWPFKSVKGTGFVFKVAVWMTKRERKAHKAEDDASTHNKLTFITKHMTFRAFQKESVDFNLEVLQAHVHYNPDYRILNRY